MEEVIDALGGVTHYGYDKVGNKISQTDPKGNTWSKLDGTNTVDYGYDYENRLSRIQTVASQVDYTYDVDGFRVAKKWMAKSSLM